MNYSIGEKNTAKFTFLLRDENGDTINLAAIGTLRLTLYVSCDNNNDNYHLATVNHRYLQNVKNTNNVVLQTSGTVIWTMQPADNTIKDTSKKEEHHIALFEVFYGGKQVNAEFDFYVKNLNYIS